MLFIIGGVPDTFYQKVNDRVANVIGTGHRFVATPMRQVYQGAYRLSQGYVDDLLSKVQERIVDQPDSIDKGAAILLLYQAWDNTDQYVEQFYPVLPVFPILLDAPFDQRGHGAAQNANAALAGIGQIAPKIVRGIAALNVEFTDKRARTPLLLPRRNFRADELDSLLRAVWGGVFDSANPTDFIRLQRNWFENRRSRSEDGGFVDDRHLSFKAPGRDLHGEATLDGPGHVARCFLEGRLRFGAPYDSRFHYDAGRGKEVIRGDFVNCHGTLGTYTGNPHLNIAPSDHVRTKQPPQGPQKRQKRNKF